MLPLRTYVYIHPKQCRHASVVILALTMVLDLQMCHLVGKEFDDHIMAHPVREYQVRIFCTCIQYVHTSVHVHIV